MKKLLLSDSQIHDLINLELDRQSNTLEMIASENFTSKAVLESVGSILTNKYAEGYPGRRYYGGCDFVDKVENIAKERLGELFNAEYTNVQPHSGSQANMGVYLTFLNAGDTVMGLDLAHGGHLTHGSKVNFSGQMYNFISYGVDGKTGRVNFNDVLEKAIEYKPKLIICGGSAYPRFIEFEKFREVADKIDAYLMADIAHPSGLIASGVHPSPWPHCHIATSTTHKTLRGPRGGVIMLGKDFENKWGKVAPKSGRVKMVSELIDSAVMPGIQGGPLMHVIAGKAVAFKEALKKEYKIYCENIVSNAKCLSNELIDLEYSIVSGGTDTHITLLDLSSVGVTGKRAEAILDKANITSNKNPVPGDSPRPPEWVGLRLGSAAATTRGLKEAEFKTLGSVIADLIFASAVGEDDAAVESAKPVVADLCTRFPVYAD